MKKKRRDRKQQKVKAQFRAHDGAINHKRIVKMNIKQLTKLAEELGIRITEGSSRHQIREQIILFSTSSSSEWKSWRRTTKDVDDKYLSSTANAITHWSPPEVGTPLPTTDKYPEKGVRIMKISEAYPDHKSALPDLKTVGLEKSYPTNQVRAIGLQGNLNSTVSVALSPICEYSKWHHKTKATDCIKAMVNNKQLCHSSRLTEKLNSIITAPPVKSNTISTQLTLSRELAKFDQWPQNNALE